MGRIVKAFIYDINKMPREINDIPLITEDDIKIAMKYKKDIDQKQHLISSYFKRKYVGNWHLSENNKPVSNNLFFNISHSNQYVIIGISNENEIGIDIEYNDKLNEKLKNHICSNLELDFIKDDNDFYKIWTSKESLLKCYGSGLINDLKKINSLPIDGLKNYNGKNYYSHYIDYNNYSISVTIMSDDDFKIELHKEEL